jgi:general secretion pathway protein A
MYNKHFGFSESPFNITPNSRFYYRNPSCDEILTIVQHGIESRKGVIVVTGEPGTGKTLFLKFLVRDLNPNVKTVIVQNPRTDFDRMLEVLLIRLDLRGVAEDRTTRLDRLTGHLIEQRSQGGIVCLLIDEAQDLDVNTLDELRLLANLEFEGDALLSIVLIGQPELNLKLDHPSATRIKQRIAISRNTHPLVRMEIGPYIHSRLKVAGYEKPGLFEREAIDRIAAYSGGIPRMVNSICDNSLIRAYTAKHSAVSAEIIDQVARDLRIPAPVLLQKQFMRVKWSDNNGRSASVANTATSAAEEGIAGSADQRAIDSVGAATHDPGSAQPQNRPPPTLPKFVEDVENAANEAPAVMASPDRFETRSESTERLADFHAQGGTRRDSPPVGLRWYTLAAVVGLLLLILNRVGSSQLPGLYSAASSTKPAQVVDASSYRSLHGEKAHSVNFIAAPVSLKPSDPTTFSPTGTITSQSQEDMKAGGKYKLTDANTKRLESVKALPAPLPRDGAPRREEAANLPAANGNRSEDNAKTIKVVAASLLRSRPSAGAEIISSLEPGSRVTILARAGDFYHVRSVDKNNPLRGYVHREDAFFERRK